MGVNDCEPWGKGNWKQDSFPSSPCACRREACQQENPDIPSTHLDTDQKAVSPGEVPIPLGPLPPPQGYSKTIKSSLRGYPKPGLRSK